MNHEIDETKSLEQLEGIQWPAPSSDATGLVKAAHELRKLPVGRLNAHELSRLIGQDIGIPWLFPLALDLLHRTASDQSLGGFYDDDLLTATLTRKSDVWRSNPGWVTKIKEIIAVLEDISPYIQEEIQEFLTESDVRR
ncbi:MULTISPECIES: contact-dependent growth inhibition system immunity protein [Streptomyces]|uniref:contact-dependent growth inhibition system immunity protein n=1 Tax=Streptomyces TaxID=1883 RepID=UPI00117D74C2|nr:MULTISPECIES: contact-dependent growth inhibition system immunity protein [unclassified Streptomyces]WTE25885.1 contact-dependent growth inhibition system immunity protein [Streptomyces anulatus]